MRGWLGVLEILGLIVLLLALALVLLAVRRRWLARQGGTFECSVRFPSSTAGAGWTLGVARYNLGVLEWYRFFSYALRPRLVLARGGIRVLASRDPDLVESVSLGADRRIVRLENAENGASEWELAMSQDSLTGLLSWLEAAPPGRVSY